LNPPLKNNLNNCSTKSRFKHIHQNLITPTNYKNDHSWATIPHTAKLSEN
jgi:hypothetical protein